MQCIEDGTDDQLLIRPMMEISSTRPEIMHGFTLRVCVYAWGCECVCEAVRKETIQRQANFLIRFSLAPCYQ